MGKSFGRSYKKSYILLPLSRLLLISLVFSISLLFFACAALADDIDITMAWDANTETDLAGYRLYYRTGSSGPPYNGTGATEGDSPITIGIGNPDDPNNPEFTLADPNNPEFTLSGLDDNQNWFFVVTAYDTSNNESGYSNHASYSGTNQPPTASFAATPTSGVAPLVVNFDASGSYDPDGNIVSYTWNFGDGATGNGATASHTYTSGNTFTVMLTVTDNAGASGSTTGQVQVSAPNQGPTASFSASPSSGLAPLTVDFDASGSYDPDGNIVSYSWNFGDGATGNGATASHTYTSGNTFTVMLTVTDNAGASGSTTGQVQVSAPNQGPTASFSASPSSGLAPLTVDFDASGSYDPDGNIVSYSWNFGDGATGNGATASHTYTSGNTFTVMLTVTDNAGASGSTTGQVQVSAPNQGPTASFSASPSSGLAPLTVDFDASGSYDPDGNIVSYSWNFGDGATGNGATASHTYTSGNTFTVMLTVTDNAGASGSTTGQVQVSAPNQGPTASFTASTTFGVAPLVVNFDASGSDDPDGSIVSYAWNFGDDATGTGSAVSHTYTPGTYIVSLTVTDNDGATDNTTGTEPILVTAPNQRPSASFSATPMEGVESLTVDFDASGSDDPDGSIVSYAWNFGDDATGTGSAVSHTYTPGTYIVSLTVTDNDGATDNTTGTRPILVTTASNLVPDTPVLYLPVDGAANESFSPNLETESFIDPDGDTHAQTQWQISGTSNFSSLVFGKTSAFYLSSLKVPTSVLDENKVYYWRVRFYDDRGGESAWPSAYSFTTEVSVTDTNPPNGVPDTQEVDGTVDVDNNGILDLDQMLSDIKFKCMNTFSGDKQIGFEGITNVASIDSVMSIDPDTIPDKPGGLPFGLISIKLRTINPGDTVEVVVYFSEPAPEGTLWYKYDSLNGWQDYSAYATFSADRKSLVLELKDGGHGDSDGVENGIIVDPGGVVGSTGGVDSAGGGGGGCFIATAAFGSYVEPQVKLHAESYSEEHDWLKSIVRVLLMPLVGISYILVRTSLAVTILVGFLLIISLISFYTVIYRRRKYQV